MFSVVVSESCSCQFHGVQRLDRGKHGHESSKYYEADTPNAPEHNEVCITVEHSHATSIAHNTEIYEYDRD